MCNRAQFSFVFKGIHVTKYSTQSTLAIHGGYAPDRLTNSKHPHITDGHDFTGHFQPKTGFTVLIKRKAIQSKC